VTADVEGMEVTEGGTAGGGDDQKEGGGGGGGANGSAMEVDGEAF